MKDYIELMTTTPFDEKCSQVGDLNYLRDSRIEISVYINQLKRAFGDNPTGTLFKITHNPHDFGVYLDIRFIYDDENDTHLDYMNEIESGVDLWDDESIKQLQKRNYLSSQTKDNIRYLKRSA
ncbi:MAG: hypothetical protein WAU36_04175 [Cyclobacteriaceae bacterium]